jgi:hypothetical protein
MNASATMAGAMKTAGAAMTSMNMAIDPMACGDKFQTGF